ncbi:MAG TPA: alpha/beta hydrolase fold domain-containing protein [Pyrinomonadaceae bacterium]|nr:alpha/beta hydrolase fold domain-containing protein [Pyrinomonadaceae bacterium]
MITPPSSACRNLYMRAIAIVPLVLAFLSGPTTAQTAEQVINPNLPTIFVVGDSTANNHANGGLGWGDPFVQYFDANQVNVLNRARGGRSSRTFITEGLWDKVLSEMKKGDFVLIQFGHNDGGKINDEMRARGSLPGTGGETQEIDNLQTKKHEVVHTYGWYLRKMIADVKSKGATPIVLSLTVRNIWRDGHVERGSGKFSEWAAEIAKSQNVEFIDLTTIIANRYEEIGQERVKELFGPDHTHTSPAGAELNAALVVYGIQKMKPSPLKRYLSKAFNAATANVTVDVWPEGRMPGSGAAEPEGERPSSNDTVQRITNVSRPTLTLFPAPKKDASPAMIVCPGGGYSYVSYNKEGTEIAEWLNSVGFSAVVLKYRVPNNREGALQDLQRAISLARAHATQWNIDPKRLGVMGFSAGGNLAAKASMSFNQRTYSPIDSIDRQSCRPDFVVLVYPAYLEKDGQIAPDLRLHSKIPPTLIIGAEDDKTYVNSGKIYHAALDAAKVKNEFLLYPTGGHGFGLRSEKDARVWPQTALEWLHRIGIR